MEIWGKKSLSVALTGLALIVCPGRLMAQSAGTGALAGTVTDPTGGRIAGVAVTATHTETNQARTATTGTDGSYKFTLLPPGSYRVRFSATGFKTAEVPSVTVNVTETPVLDRTLEIGTQSDQITVITEAEVLQTQDSTLGTVVGGQAVVGLPLTNRNYTQILSMSAGANVSVNNAAAFGKGSQDVSVNGNNTNQNNYQMDGVNIDNFAGNNLGGDAGIYVGIGVPNPDALEEFKIQTSTYDASYGRNPGGNVNVVTRSGTNQIHGSLFEFFRNTDLNAVDFFRNRAGGSRQVLNQNQFGGTFGMPIKKDKLFFFFSYQETRQINGVGTQGYSTPILPPIPAGDRSSSTFRSALGAAFCPQNHPGDSRYTTVAGGVQVACDGSNINPVTLAFLNLKLPNGQYYIPSSGTGTFTAFPFSPGARFTEHQAVANLDYLMSSKHTLGLRFFTSQDPQTIPNSAGGASAAIELPGTPANYLYANTNAVAKLTSLLTNSLVNEGRLSYQRNVTASSNGVPFTATQLGMAPINPAIPVMSGITVQGQFNMGGGIGDDVFNPTDQFQIADTISWTHGRQTVRAGFEIEHINWDIVFKGIERGNITVSSFPDFLIGRAGCDPGNATCSVANPGTTTGTPTSNIASCLFCVRSGPDGIIHGYRADNYSWFVQDDYKVSNKLTLNMGVRWEYDGTLSDKYGNLTNVWQSLIQAVNTPAAVAGVGPFNGATPTSGGTLAGYVVPNNFSKFYGNPPAGVFQSSRTLPVRSGPPLNNFGPRFGFAYQAREHLVVRGGVGLFFDRFGGNLFVHSVEQGNPYAVTLDYAGSAAQPASLQNPFPSTPLEFVPRWANFSNNTSSNLNLPFIDEVIHTPLVRQYNLGIQYEFLPRWVLELGYVGSSGINLVDYNHNYNTASLASPTNPINGITTNTVQNANLRVPYLGFAASGLQGTGFDGISNYNSLQATIRKRLTHGVTFAASYTWSKALTDLIGYGANLNNASNLAQQYGPAYFNRPQRFALNYSWDIPGHANGVLGKLIEGWNVSGVTVAQNGVPLTITDARAGTIYGVNGPTPTAPGLNTVSFGTVNVGRAQMAPGATYSSMLTPGGVEARLGGLSGGPGYFTAGSFVLPPAIGNGFDYGNSGIGVLLGPGQFNWDMSLVKRTKITEKQEIQFRTEFFNTFNHPQFNNPGTAFSTPATFGVITSTSVNPRLIQFALKYSF